MQDLPTTVSVLISSTVVVPRGNRAYKSCSKTGTLQCEHIITTIYGEYTYN